MTAFIAGILLLGIISAAVLFGGLFYLMMDDRL